MKNTLEDYDGHWPTSIGLSFAMERAVMHGADLLNDLVTLDWMTLHFFSITGRKPCPDKMKAMMVAWTGCSYPDPRVWNNRVAALAGTTRSTAALAIGAATAMSEATLYGHRANKKCIDTLLRAKHHTDSGGDLAEFVDQELEAGRKLYGYGRPIKNGDERIEPMIRRLKETGLENDPFIVLTQNIETIIEEKKGLAMNITGLTAGLAASLGLTAIQYHLFLCPVFTIGFSPCYLDATEKPAGCLFPMRCDRIEYTGPQPRKW